MLDFKPTSSVYIDCCRQVPISLTANFLASIHSLLKIENFKWTLITLRLFLEDNSLRNSWSTKSLTNRIERICMLYFLFRGKPFLAITDFLKYLLNRVFLILTAHCFNGGWAVLDTLGSLIHSFIHSLIKI